jgi:HK97 family phage major capsid protein
MANLFDMKKQRHHALNKADGILKLAENANRELTASEQQDVDVCMTTVHALNPKIELIESKNTLAPLFNRLGGVALLSQERTSGSPRLLKSPERVLSHDYVEAFYSNLASKGTQPSAALYEGSDGAGGYAVPLIVDSQIVPLAPTDTGVREVATVIPTTMGIKIPRATTISTAAAKAEGTGDGTKLFTESEPVLDQFTLSAFMAGLAHIISWELAQDVPSFQSFCVGDMLLAQSIFEENWYVNGNGTGQAQGLLGNTGAGVTAAAADSAGNLLSIDATFDVMGLLKTPYHANASWLMSRASSIELRKAQKQSNLFEPVFVRVGKQDFLHGYPVVYSTAMPAIAASATPVLFGDFKQGYVIGDRGGSRINVKILDQPRATEGLVVLLCYRRTDGRVRRSEAIQAITLHASS